MDILNKAIAAFSDENSDLKLGDRISILRSALSEVAFERLKAIAEYGPNSKEADDLEIKNSECMKLFKIIEQMYYSQMKQNKMTGKSADEGMGSDFLKKIKNEKGAIGDIVRDLKPSNN